MVESNSPRTENYGFIRKSPPIFIKNITNLNALDHDFILILGPDVFTFTISKDLLKIKTPNKKKYWKISWSQICHRYLARSIQSKRQFVIYITPYFPTRTLKQPIEEMGFSVLNVENILNRSNKLQVVFMNVVKK